MPPLRHERPNFAPKTNEELEIEQQMAAATLLVRGRMSDLIPAISPNHQANTWISSRKAIYQTQDQVGTDEYTHAWFGRRVNQVSSDKSFHKNYPTFEVWTAAGGVSPNSDDGLINQLAMYDDDRCEFSEYPDMTPRQKLEQMNSIADTLALIAQS
jgi:hypothetical protein